MPRHSAGISRTALVTSWTWMPRFDEQRQDGRQLAIADERLAADDRDVQRAMAIDERHDAVDELLALEVADLAQREVAAEMIVAVGVAAGTAERAFAGDLDGERRRVAGEDSTPGWENTFHRATIAAVW